MASDLRSAIARIPRWVLAIGLAWVVVGSILTWRWVLSPPSTDGGAVDRSDAIVLFVGGRGERLELAQRLVEAGVAPVLVIPNGARPGWAAANELCGVGDAGGPISDTEPSVVEVLCPTPDPDNTRGEARLIAALADERGWQSVTMVTSTYQLARAELMLDRCFDGKITAVAATPRDGPGGWARLTVHEWLGHLHARVLARGC